MEHNLNILLQKVAISLALYLERALPSLFEDWWKQAVLPTLSSEQRRRMEQRPTGSLGALDLAALLRVFDQNWYQLSTSLGLTKEARHSVKEMQTIYVIFGYRCYGNLQPVRRTSMKGIQFVTDSDGEKTAVLIDLRQHGDVWEDFYDLLLAQARQDEPRETLDQVRSLLISQGKLDG